MVSQWDCNSDKLISDYRRLIAAWVNTTLALAALLAGRQGPVPVGQLSKINFPPRGSVRVRTPPRGSVRLRTPLRGLDRVRNTGQCQFSK